MTQQFGDEMDDVVRFPGRTRPLSEDEALVADRRV
jgi:hypothetical protein